MAEKSENLGQEVNTQALSQDSQSQQIEQTGTPQKSENQIIDQTNDPQIVVKQYEPITLLMMKDILTQFRSKMKLNMEPCQELQKIIDILEQISDNQDEIFKDNLEISDYFHKEFVNGVVKQLVQNIKVKVNNQEFIEIIKQLPILFAKILCNNIDNFELLDSIKCVFDHQARLYQYHVLSEENSILFANSIDRISEEDKKFRDLLEVGSVIEAVKIEPLLNCKSWSRCIVKHKSSDNKIKISFENDSHIYDREIGIYAPDISEISEKSKSDEEYRESLKVGDFVDCYDSTKFWYASTVVGIDKREFQGQLLKMAQIAFRVNHPDGDQTDTDGNKFFGWDSTYDEWITLYSPRISKFQTYTTDNLQNQTLSAQNKKPVLSNNTTENAAENPVDDSFDIIIGQKIQDKKIFAVQRALCKSDLLVNFLNAFGELDGFTKILKRIQACEKDPYELIRLNLYCECFALSYPLYNKNFVLEYFPIFELAVKNQILQSNPSQLRNLRKESTAEILDHLYKKILTRTGLKDPIDLQCDKQILAFDIGLLFLKTDLFQRRIDGLKMIAEICTNALRIIKGGPSPLIVTANSKIAFEKKMVMVEEISKKLLKDGQIVSQVFSKERTHAQLVQRAEPILRFLIGQNAMDNQIRDQVWKTLEYNDPDLKIEILKTLNGISVDMQNDDRIYFVDKIQQIPLNEISDRLVDLLKEICISLRESQKSLLKTDMIGQALTYIWKIVFENKSQSQDLNVNRAALGFSEILKNQKIEIKLVYIDKLAECIKNNNMAYLSIKVLARIMKISFENNGNSEGNSQDIQNLEMLISHLEQKHDLFNKFIENFKYYMKNVNEQILDPKREDLKGNENLQVKVIFDMFVHSDQISERIEFIKFYCKSQHMVKLDEKKLNILWQEIAIKSLIENDKKQIYTFLKEICDSFQKDENNNNNKIQSQIVNIEDLKKFCSENIFHENTNQEQNSSMENLNELSLEGFQCMQSFFILLNEINGKIQRIAENFGTYKGKHFIENKPQEEEKNKEKNTQQNQDAQPQEAEKADTKKQVYTSYSSETGAQYGTYSFTKKDDQTEDKGVGTSTVEYGVIGGPILGPVQGPVQGPVMGPVNKLKQQQAAKGDDHDESLNGIVLQILVPPKQLLGYKTLWRVATESTSKAVIDAAAKFLIQVHHDVKIEFEDQISDFDDAYIDECFSIMKEVYPQIKSRPQEETEQINKKIDSLPISASQIMILRVMPPQERKIIRTLFLLRQLIRASEKNGTFNLRPHESLKRCQLLPNIQVQNNITHGDKYRQRLELSISNQATLWDLKKLIGQEVIKTTLDGGKTYGVYPDPQTNQIPHPVHPACIRLFQMSNSNDLKDPKNGETLKELKLKSNENLGAYRKSSYMSRRVPILVDNHKTGEAELTEKALEVTEEIFEEFSIESEIENSQKQRMMKAEQAILFTHKCTGTPSSVDDSRYLQFIKNYGAKKEAADVKDQFISLDGFRQFFIDSCIQGREEKLRMNIKRLGYSQDLTRLPKDGEPENIQQQRKLKEEMPRYKVANNDQYFEFLLELLDFHREVNTRATEVINMLVTHPVLLKSVQNLQQQNLKEDSQKGDKFDWNQIFDSKNVHKMHYSLEILEAIMIINHQEQLNEDPKLDDMIKWVKKFIDLGGIEQLQKQLKEALERLSESDKSVQNWKKVVDQLLKLIRMFVVTAAADSNDKYLEIVQQSTECSENQDNIKNPNASTNQKEKHVNFADEAEEVKYEVPVKNVQIQNDYVQTNNFEITQDSLFGDDQINSESHPQIQTVLAISAKGKSISESAQQDDSSLELLKKIMKQNNFGEEVMQRVDIQQLQQQVIQVVNLQLGNEELQKEDRLIVESAMSLWQMLILESKYVNASIVKIDQEFLIKGILGSKDYRVRESFQTTFYQISKKSGILNSQILQILIDQLSEFNSLQVDQKSNLKTQHFFGLFVQLAKQIQDSLSKETILDLLIVLTQALNNHQSLEKRNQLIIDSTLKGYLDLISTILDGLYTKIEKDRSQKDEIFQSLNQQNLINQIYQNCLFELQNSNLNTIDENKILQCCSSESRKSAYKVLESFQKFMNPLEMVKYLKNFMNPILKDIERPGKWRHSPSNKGRIHQHCGIVNLGCICYMISMLQQFFMVPQFRYQLLKAVDDSPENLKDYKDEKVDDNLLRQLQKMFGFLEISERQAYNPKDFCFAFKELDGTPTKIGEQKDSQEFLNIFFDRLEHILKPTSQKYLLQDVFLGNQCSQMICQQCGQVKNRIESFYNLSLQVKGSVGIYDSLNKLVFGQTIEDYNCDGCKKKVNITKRSLLADTPNTLIVHLQKIMFSFDTMQNDKINTRFEFPIILDLKEYSYKNVMTKENNQNLSQEHASLMNISDDDYIYRLVGVNVHVGTADHGHYYSLIDIKRGIQEIDPYLSEQNGETLYKKWADIQSDPWKTFNDDKVGIFDFEKNIKEEAFGSGGDSADLGKTSDAMTDAELAQFLSTGSKAYGKSAYMLIYERKSKKNLREVVLSDQKQQQENESQSEQIETIDFRKLQKSVPQWISDLVNKDNKTFIVDSQMFHDHFFDYLKSIFKIIGSDMVMTSHQYDYNYGINFLQLKEESLKFGGKVLFDMLCYFDHNIIINDFCSNFETILLFTDSPMSLESGDRSIVAQFIQNFFLEDGCDHFYKIMFNCVDAGSRKSAGQILGKAVNRLFKIYNEVKPELRDSNDAIKEVKDTIDKITDLLIIVLQTKECQKNWSKLESYFKLLLSISTTTISQAQYMLEKYDMISEIIDFVLGNSSPRMSKNLGEKRVAMGGTVRPPFQPLFTLVSYLVRMTHTGQMDLEKREATHIDVSFATKFETHKTYFISDEARQMLEETDFLDKGLQDNQYDDNKEYCLAIAHLCFRNLQFSRKYIYRLLKAISFSDNDQIKRYLAIIEEIARIKDEFQVHRLEYLFGFGFIMHVKNNGDDLIQYGQQVHKDSKMEDVFQIFTTVDARVHDDSLLNMLLKYKSRMDSFTLSCLQSLCTLIANDKAIGLYFSKLPAADYTQQRYTDWIKPYLDIKLIDIKKYSSSSGSAEKEEQIMKIISLFSIYQQFLDELINEGEGQESQKNENTISQNKQIPFLIKKAVSEKSILRKQFDEAFSLEIYQVACQWEPITNQFDDNLENQQDSSQPQENSVESQNQDIDQIDSKLNVQINEDQTQISVCEDLLYRLTITNNLEIGIKLNIDFSIKKSENENENVQKIEDLNIELPVSGLRDYIKPSQTAHIITLRKKSPNCEFDINQLDISITHEPYLENDYQMGSYASQTHKPIPLSSQNADSNKNKPSNTGRRNGIIGDLIPTQTQGQDFVVSGSGLQQALEYERLQQNNYIDEEFNGVGVGLEGSEKECPACTFLNPVMYNVCEICNHEFN